MPRSKNRAALFEVYSKSLPSSPPEEPPPKASTRRRVRATQAASAFKATLNSLARVVASGDRDDTGPRTRAEPVAEVGTGTIHVRLTRPMLIGGVVALLLILVGVFVAGHWWGRQSGFADGRQFARQRGGEIDEIAEARQSTPVANLFEGVGTSPVSVPSNEEFAAPRLQAERSVAASPPAKSTGWTKGLTYVVVQNFRGDAHDDAVQARAYLAQHGIDTKIVGRPGRGFRLISARGFDRSKPVVRRESDRFKTRIRSLGAAYHKAGGRYKLEGYFATLTSDSW